MALRRNLCHKGFFLIARRSCSSSSSLSKIPSLDIELPNLPKLRPATDLPLPTTKITKLDNGITVASHEDYGNISSVGVFVNAGSQFESKENNGVSYLLEKMAFSSTKNKSSMEVMRDIEDIGGNVLVNSSREQIVYQIEFLRSELPTAVQLLAENLLEPSFSEPEIADAKATINHQRMDMNYDPQVLVQEWLHEAAFGKGTPLGQPLMTPEEQFPKLGEAQLQEFLQSHFVGSNMVVAGAGVDHEELVKSVGKSFAKFPKGDPRKHDDDQYEYTGGEVRIEADPPQQAVSETFVEPPPAMTHIMLGFGTGGWHSKDLVPLCVLHALLGGGSSFSAGGPGKGMYTRLYREILNRHYWVDSAIATSVMLYGRGLLGIYGTSEPQHAFSLARALVQQMTQIGVNLVSEEEMSRAQNQLKSRVLMNLESRNILCEDIGRQLLTYGYREQASTLCAKIDSVTREDILQLSKKMLATRPSMVAYGDLSKVPAFEEVERVFSTFRAVGSEQQQ